ncbi:hypothetical protein GY45DRAFT_1433093 [Cubamyces sp. BRFM 1775]|nr:hypothetical protein GY45DRAFT_1433093 [Cubamyces sp. BRFM 1775]
MAEDEQDGPDLETLQAQIDMSMAFTNSIVSGWMKSSKAKLPSYSRNDDKELEEYMRRPARLGVGASVPESTGVLSRESAKLRNKLTGQGKKREREEEAEPPRAGANKKAATADSDDDEEDSRARVITKKARVDPFAAKGEGKKKKKKADPMAVSQAVGKAKAVPSALPSASKGGDEADTDMESPSKGAATAQSPDGDAPAPAPTSRKKKKKKKHKEGAVGPTGDGQSADPELREHARSSPTSDLPARVSASKHPSSKIAGSPQAPSSEPAVGESASYSQSAGTSIAATAGTDGAVSSTKKTTTRQDPLGLPLLNLSGPPPVVGGDHPESPKKKRKRKKKKKKAVAQSTADADAMDVDGHDDEAEDD